jgi:antitoxin component YwqK of YwqJK toxin-antitoxin module
VYLKDKQILQYYTYKNGKLNGLTKIYDKSGNILSEGNYKEDEKDGIWKFYDDGKVVQTIKYPLPKTPLKVKKKQTD